MKCFILFVMVTLFAKPGVAQTNLVGGWYTQDSTTKISLIFDQDGSVTLQSAPVTEIFTIKSSKKGTYNFKNSKLIIHWEDGRVEKSKVLFVDASQLKLKLRLNEGAIRSLSFLKITEEEVLSPT